MKAPPSNWEDAEKLLASMAWVQCLNRAFQIDLPGRMFLVVFKCQRIPFVAGSRN
jgi:hypothetical protein